MIIHASKIRNCIFRCPALNTSLKVSFYTGGQSAYKVLSALFEEIAKIVNCFLFDATKPVVKWFLIRGIKTNSGKAPEGMFI